ncbi:chemotaxis protein CheD [candidate division KSB1 bacterium]
MMLNNIMVGIGGFAVSNSPGKIIKTMALGSCVGIVVYEPKLKVAGLLHVALPESKIMPDKARKLPGYFADTGIKALLNELRKYGINPQRSLKVKIAGGANVMDAENVFSIGKRNILSVRKQLWQNRLSTNSEDIGGEISRTMWIEVDTGRVGLYSPRKGEWDI